VVRSRNRFFFLLKAVFDGGESPLFFYFPTKGTELCGEESHSLFFCIDIGFCGGTKFCGNESRSLFFSPDSSVLLGWVGEITMKPNCVVRSRNRFFAL
jgi:hypothetical protein